MNQRQRTRTISQFRKGRFRFLVATDVAARGIDVQTISHVINFDIPNCAEDYVHRIGRTGRAGANGVALSFAAPRDFRLVRSIEQFIGQKMTASVVPGMEPTKKMDAPSAPSSRFKKKVRFPLLAVLEKKTFQNHVLPVSSRELPRVIIIMECGDRRRFHTASLGSLII